MSTTTRPPLVAGDRLTQPEFHARYEQMPRGVKARLIGGVVYIEGDGVMSSPVGRKHATTSNLAGGWLNYYWLRTPGVQAMDNVTVILDGGETQPDSILHILPEYGGAAQYDGNFIRGAPELVVEVADSSRYEDLGPQLLDFEQAGVLEYVVFAHDPDEVRWHVLRDGRLQEVKPDLDGVFRSRVFPGLWLDPVAFWAGDKAAHLRTIEAGLNSDEHAAFVARLRGDGR